MMCVGYETLLSHSYVPTLAPLEDGIEPTISLFQVERVAIKASLGGWGKWI